MVLTKLNSDLFAILKHAGMPLLTTAFYLVANWKSGQMRFANAGHPRPLHVQRSHGQVLPMVNSWGTSQPALGLTEDTVYNSSEIKLVPQDLIVLFTDGLYEVQAPDNSIYTQALLLEAVKKRIQAPASQLFDEVLAEIRLYSASGGFADDVCMVGVE